MQRIRIGIGTEPRTEIARKVLEYSILKSCKSEVEFYPLLGEDFKSRGLLGQGTGFSFLRFILPEYFNYEGRAIYLDADMLVLTDLTELWEKDQGLDNIVWCKLGNEERKMPETSMMLIDCQAAENKIYSLKKIENYLLNDIERKKYREIMKLQYLKPQPIEISRWWNVMDKGCLFSKPEDFSSKKAKILHFTDIKNQPWFQPENPNAIIWGQWLRAALKDGYLDFSELQNAVEKFDYSNPKRPNGLHPFWIKNGVLNA